MNLEAHYAPCFKTRVPWCCYCLSNAIHCMGQNILKSLAVYVSVCVFYLCLFHVMSLVWYGLSA